LEIQAIAGVKLLPGNVTNGSHLENTEDARTLKIVTEVHMLAYNYNAEMLKTKRTIPLYELNLEKYCSAFSIVPACSPVCGLTINLP
jgi:hypothetical protein